MRIKTGFEIVYDCPSPVPMLLMLSVHPSRRGDLETPDWVRTDPNLEVRQYLDVYGNICSRLLAPSGRVLDGFNITKAAALSRAAAAAVALAA